MSKSGRIQCARKRGVFLAALCASMVVQEADVESSDDCPTFYIGLTVESAIVDGKALVPYGGIGQWFSAEYDAATGKMRFYIVAYDPQEPYARTVTVEPVGQ